MTCTYMRYGHKIYGHKTPFLFTTLSCCCCCCCCCCSFLLPQRSLHIYMADAMSMKKKTTSIPVVLIGCGGVGQQLLHHIIATRALHANSQVSYNNYTHSPSSSPIPTACRPTHLISPSGSSWIFMSF